MEESEIESLTDHVAHALKRRVDGLPEDARMEEYALLVGQVRALRALAHHLAALPEASDEHTRTLDAMRRLSLEMAR